MTRLLLLAAAHATRDLSDMQLLTAANVARLAGDDASANLLMAVLSGRCEPRGRDFLKGRAA